MNLIGQIDSLINGYQEEITIAVVIIISVIAAIALVRSLYNIEKNRRNLEELSSTISEINEKVNQLSLKEEMKPAETKERREVIYIDNRTTLPAKPEIQETEKPEPVKTVQNVSEPAEVKEVDEIIEEAAAIQQEVMKQSEEEIPEVRKYFNRNDFISKNGKKYSKEELEKQIR